MLLKTSQTEPASVLISSIFFGPISANIAFFLYYSSAAAFFGSFGFGGGGGFPPLAFAS